jgi:hypothetical protein
MGFTGQGKKRGMMYTNYQLFPNLQKDGLRWKI